MWVPIDWKHPFEAQFNEKQLNILLFLLFKHKTENNLPHENRR